MRALLTYNKWILCTLLTGFLLPAMAQGNKRQEERQWSIGVQGNMSWQTTQSNSYPQSARSLGASWKATVEYYIPQTNFSLKGGYDGEELSLFSGNISTQLHQLNIGGRYYIPLNIPVHFFVGADLFWNMASLNNEGNYEESTLRNDKWVKRLERSYTLRNPRFSVAPTVGADIYLLSHLAFYAEYGYRIGFNSHTSITTTDASGNTYLTKAKGNRHVMSLGLKVIFPFSFTRSDVDGIFDWILGN